MNQDRKKNSKSGKTVKCIVIPMEQNHLFYSEKGNVYLDLVCFDLKEPKEDQTHLVKQSLNKKVRDAMSDEERNAVPLMGSLNNREATGNDVPDNTADVEALRADDDLPF